jgi:hypothetical protein
LSSISEKEPSTGLRVRKRSLVEQSKKCSESIQEQKKKLKKARGRKRERSRQPIYLLYTAAKHDSARIFLQLKQVKQQVHKTGDLNHR